MTHFPVAVIAPEWVDDIVAYIKERMEPYNENTDVAPYVCYSREQAAREIAETIHRLELVIRRQEPHHDLDRCREEIERLRCTTPEERYRERVKSHESFNEHGQPLSTCNPNSKWDWYVVGGRWDGWINDRDTSRGRIDDNIATTRQVIERKKIPHAIITPDGQWQERGRLGWWGILHTENECWDEQAHRIFAAHPGYRVVIIDAHI